MLILWHPSMLIRLHQKLCITEISANLGGYIVAFGLPESGNEETTNSTTMMQHQGGEASGISTSAATPSNTLLLRQHSRAIVVAAIAQSHKVIIAVQERL